MFGKTRKPRPGEYFSVHRLSNGDLYFVSDSDGKFLRGMDKVDGRDIIWNQSRTVGRFAPSWWRKELGIPLGAVLPDVKPWGTVPRPPGVAGPRDGEVDVRFTIVGYSGTFEALDAALKRLYDAEGWEIVGQGMSGSPRREEPSD